MTAKCAITLVHGTFARGAAWTSAGSPIRAAMERLVGPSGQVFAFQWSGRNTHHDRLAAAGRLAEHLLEIARRHPGIEQFVIAHSHGGNIALYAARQSQISRLSIITLGTPFIRVKARELEGVLELFRNTAMTLCVVLGIIGPLMLLLERAEDALLVLPVIGIVGACIFFVHKLFDDVLPPWVRHRQEKLETLAATCARSQRLFVVTVGGDEAEFWLRAVDFFGEFPARLVGIITAVMEFIALIKGIILRSVQGADVVSQVPAFQPFFAVVALVGVIVTLAPIALALFCLPIWFLSAIRRAGYQDDTLLNNAVIRLSIETEPTIVSALRGAAGPENTGDQIRIKYPREHSFFFDLIHHVLQHSSIYQNERIIADVCNWIQRGEVPAGSLPFSEETTTT